MGAIVGAIIGFIVVPWMVNQRKSLKDTYLNGDPVPFHRERLSIFGELLYGLIGAAIGALVGALIGIALK